MTTTKSKSKQTETSNQNLDESTARVKLAAVYRLIDYFGWNDLTLTHASTRVPSSDSHFLINSIGIYFDQIKASNLVKMDFKGNVVGNNSLPVNPTGFIIHSAILEARPDLNTVIHAHTPYGVVVSTLECGLLPMDQTGIRFQDQIAYHDYSGLAIEMEEKARLVADLGKEKSSMIMRNHGLVVCGRSIEEAFVNLYFLESACRTQVLAMSTGAKLNQPSNKVLSSVSKKMKKARTPDKSNPQQFNLYGRTFDALIQELDRLDPSYRD
ncbi:MAG: class II aldolase/adducin family protein [Xenococcus sp. MO_188.B8]|nr:class II aldolase/adducin family protein [Xenococcus sp. MO_188.B8]